MARSNDADTPILTRKNRIIGVEVSLVFMAAEDPECRWQTECAHGNCVGHRTRKLGESFVSVPWEWCTECREVRDRVTDQTPELTRTPQQNQHGHTDTD